jgi:hypothetical protein
VSNARHSRGFNILELLMALVIGLTLIAAFLLVLQRSQRDITTSESLAHLQGSARHALGLVVADLEHAGFFGFASPGRVQLVRAGAVLAEGEALFQPRATSPRAGIAGLPAGAHDCGVNFAIDLFRSVQGADNEYAFADAPDCAPTASAGGAAPMTDTLTVRHASLQLAAPRAGRLQVYSAARSASAPVLLFADGLAPGPIDEDHELRDLVIHSYYIANHSVDRRGWPALRVKSLTESRGAMQFRDEEVMPGVEDLQVELAIAGVEDGERVVRYVAPDSARAAGNIVAVRLWLRIRADVTEPGHHDDRPMTYANVVFSPTAHEARQRRLVVERTVALRNALQ